MRLLIFFLLCLGVALAQSDPSPAAISTCVVEEWSATGQGARWTCYPTGGLVEMVAFSPALPSLAVLLSYSVGLGLGRSI